MSIEAMTRVWMVAPHDGKPLTVLLALADHANAASICWPSATSLMLFSRTRHERNLRQYLRQLEASGDLYYHRGNGRAHRSQYLVATGLSKDEIYQVLIDREHFDMKRDEATAIAEELVVRQTKAQATFEQVVSLADLRARRRFGSGPRPERKKEINRSSFSAKGGSIDPPKGDQPIRPNGDQSIQAKGDQQIQQKGRSAASPSSKPALEPPDHEPSDFNRHDEPPSLACAANQDGGDGGLTQTGLFLLEELNTNVSVAKELGDLPLVAVKQLVARKHQAGAQTGAIVQALRLSRGRLLQQASQSITVPSDSMQRAHTIAPEADGLELQYLLLDLEDGYSDDEVRERYEEQRLAHLS